MAREIERKFRVHPAYWTLEVLNSPSTLITQGYLNLDKTRQVRVRTVEPPDGSPEECKAYLTIKGKAKGITRDEFEYEIPFKDALAMLGLVEGSLIVKTRIKYGRWEIDVFQGDNEDLVIAEIELESEDEPIELPRWIGEEVSTISRYSNINLAVNPYCNWKS